MLLKTAQTLKIGLKTTTLDSYPYLYRKIGFLYISIFYLLELYNLDKRRTL